jgi:uroporphyrinogen-III decarboxylase
MTDAQWRDLLRVIGGERLARPPVGAIADSPWLPGWAGAAMLDYFADPAVWLQCNLEAVRRFPDLWFLPGFWAEFGMCTEPSAFGGRCVWHENAFPSIERSLVNLAEIARLSKPNCHTDGLLPFVLRRLATCRGAIEKAGHRIRFAVARGPLNIASYLLGQTEFLVGVKTEPEAMHRLLAIVSEFLVDWIGLQCDTFDSIDGVLLLDDLIGFLRDDDFQQFALPYVKQVFDARRVSVRFLHNDAAGLITAKHAAAMGVNLYNFSYNHPMAEIRRLAGPTVALLGNIPPRDVLAAGTPEDVRRAVADMLHPLDARRGIVVSCGGGLPPGVSSENLDAMCEAAGA